MMHSKNMLKAASSSVWLRLLRILVLLPGLLACDSLTYGSKTSIIHLNEVSPQSLPGNNNIWTWSIDEVQLYLRLLGEVDEQLVAEVLVDPDKSDPNRKIRVLRPYTGYLTPLSGNWYLATINIDDEEIPTQTYLVVRIEADKINVPAKGALSKDQLAELASRFGLTLNDSGSEISNTDKKKLLAFFSALRDMVKPEQLDVYKFIKSLPDDAYEGAVNNFCDEINLLPSYTATSRKYNLEVAIAYLRLLDRRDMVCATYLLARFYAEGRVLKKNVGKADAYAQKALGKGYERARYVLGYMTLHGLGRDKDEKQAKDLFRLAAEAGEPLAMFQLGEMALQRKEISKALSWYGQAIERGHTDAAFQLGRYYLDGKDVEQNKNKAFDLFTHAARNVHQFDIFFLNIEPGHRDATMYLGWMYENGVATNKDMKEAKSYYNSAANRGSTFAQWRLGDILTRDNTTARKMEEGMKWLREAADKGNTDARKRLDELTASSTDRATASPEASDTMVVELPSPQKATANGAAPVRVVFSRALKSGDSFEIRQDGVTVSKLTVSGEIAVTAIRVKSILMPLPAELEFILRRSDGKTAQIKRSWRPADIVLTNLNIQKRIKDPKWKIKVSKNKIVVNLLDTTAFMYFVDRFSIDTPRGILQINQSPLATRALRWEFELTENIASKDVKFGELQVTNQSFSELVPFLKEVDKMLSDLPVKARKGRYYITRRTVQDILAELYREHPSLADAGFLERYCQQNTPSRLGRYNRRCLKDGRSVYKTRSGNWIYKDGRKVAPEVVYGN